MSRIDEALRRITGAPPDTRSASLLKRFSVEKAPKDDDAKVSHFGAPGPFFPVESEPVASPRVSIPAATKAPARSFASFSNAEPIPAPPASSPQEQPDLSAEAESTPESEKLVDFQQVANYAGFLARSVRRHKQLAGGTFLLAVILTSATVVLLPKTYHADTKLLAQRNAVMAALSNPGRSVPWDADAPTRAAAETILRRDNIIALIRQNNLIAEWERTRAPILKFKDAVTGFVFGNEVTPEEKLDQMVDLLTNSMVVVAGPVGDGTVTIDLDWPDAQMAYNLVQSAEQAFLVARQAAETAAINESIGILENYSTTLHVDIDRTVGELQRTKAARRLAAGSTTRVRAAATTHMQVVPAVTELLPPLPSELRSIPALGADLDDPELPRMKAAITQKRAEIAKLEEARQQQLSELQTKLGTLTAVYTSSHPSVLTVQHNIATLSQEPPQIGELKMAADKLEGEYQTRVAAAAELEQDAQRKAESAEAAAGSRQKRASAGEVRVAAAPPTAEEQRDAASSDETDFTAIRLRLQLNQIMSVLERTDAARIELAVSQKAFKYRYTVITPAQVPKVPIRPHSLRVLAAGLLAGLILALLASAGKDLLSNRILEQWQIERQLGLPVLGTLVSV